jgi:hypothetical protein
MTVGVEKNPVGPTVPELGSVALLLAGAVAALLIWRRRRGSRGPLPR